MKKLIAILLVSFFATAAFAAEPMSEPAGAATEAPKSEAPAPKTEGAKKTTKKKSTKKKSMKKKKAEGEAGTAAPAESK